MKINRHIFRAYDIRGTAEATENQSTPDLTPEVAEAIGRASGRFLIAKDNIRDIMVGRDNRLHGRALQIAFMKGLAAVGMKVVDVGLATSPMIYYATCKYPKTAGANITASHNPKKDNGIKLVREGAHCVSGEELQEILRMIEEETEKGWIPAFAGMTEREYGMTERAGMTEKEYGMTEKEYGMTEKEYGMTEREHGMTEREHGMTEKEHGMTEGESGVITKGLPVIDGTAKVPGEAILKDDLFEDYLADVKARVKLLRPLKIVVDTGNGVAGKFAPVLLREVGAEVVELFTELDGSFPNHEANPEQPKNMMDLGEKVRECGADLGIGFDGDGDRIGLVDEHGEFQSIEPPMILLARELLQKMPGEKIVFDVKISRTLIDEIKKHGGVPVMSRTGHSFMHARLQSEDAPLAGEKSGHMFFSKKYFNYFGFDDAMFAACKILEVVSATDKKYSEHFVDLPHLVNTPEVKAFCPDDRKFAVIEELQKVFLPQYDCITIDGVRINFDEHSWGLIRASNTSPAFTLLFEAPTEARLEEIKSVVFQELAKFPEVKLP